MILDNAIRNSEAESRALTRVLGGEERIVYPFDVLLRDSNPGVTDVNQHHGVVHRGVDTQFPAARHCIPGIEKEVDEDLL